MRGRKVLDWLSILTRDSSPRPPHSPPRPALADGPDSIGQHCRKVLDEHQLPGQEMIMSDSSKFSWRKLACIHYQDKTIFALFDVFGSIFVLKVFACVWLYLPLVDTLLAIWLQDIVLAVMP